MQDEYSPGGSRIYRYDANERSSGTPHAPARHLELIEGHLERFLGSVDGVFHEIISDLVHLDVLHVPASGRKPYATLVTSGASDLPMTVPEGFEEYRRAEFLINLPSEWPLNELENEDHYWPIRWLKIIGRLPHEYGTWLGWGHTIPNGDPPEPIANTPFTGVMLLPPYWADRRFFQLSTGLGYKISFYNVVPLYPDELAFKLRKGPDKLEERLERIGAGEVLDIGRPSSCRRWPW